MLLKGDYCVNQCRILSSVIVLLSAIRQLCYHCASAVLCYFSRNSALSCNTYILLSPGVWPQGLCSRLGTGTQTVRPHTRQKMTNNQFSFLSSHQYRYQYISIYVYIYIYICYLCIDSSLMTFIIWFQIIDMIRVSEAQLSMIYSFVVPCGHPRPQKTEEECGLWITG